MRDIEADIRRAGALMTQDVATYATVLLDALDVHGYDGDRRTLTLLREELRRRLANYEQNTGAPIDYPRDVPDFRVILALRTKRS